MQKTQKPKNSPEPPSEEYANFDKAMRKAIAVPKEEIDRREKEWQAKEHKQGRPKKNSP